MAQLWGGRFTKETDQLVYAFNASIGFDQKFFAEDVAGSRAHVKMLAKQGVITEDEMKVIIDGLDSIEQDVCSGKIEITDEYEDIHSFVEANLIDRIGDPSIPEIIHMGNEQSMHVGIIEIVLIPTFGLPIFKNEVFIAVAIVIDDVCHRFIVKARHIGDGGGLIQFYQIEPSSKPSFIGSESSGTFSVACRSVVAA